MQLRHCTFAHQSALSSSESMFISFDSTLTADKWEDYTLIIPCVSIGNVGQLASDLIISTLWMCRVGAIDSDAVVPVVGNNPFAAPTASGHAVFELCTALEVFECQEERLVALQQRSPCVPGRAAALAREILSFAERFRFRRCLVLTSSVAAERRDDSLTGRQQRFLCDNASRASFDLGRLSEHGVKELDPAAPLPGSGLAKRLASACAVASRPCLVLQAFVAEGDNTRDAVELADCANAVLAFVDLTGKDLSGRQRAWRVPASWRLMYGAQLEQVLFQ